MSAEQSGSGEIPLVTVVVPAYNAELTLARTLASVRAQTYAELEILVVDDGSIDATAEIVRAAAATDPRVRLITKPNGGVASARNAGLATASARFVAFVDADDLWHPTRIEKQLARLISGGEDMAFVYSPFRAIDADDCVLYSAALCYSEGWVFLQHLYFNFVGNGSALLARTAHVREVGGYDPGLQAGGAQGCEDILLQARLAARYRVGVVPEYLIGYRLGGGRMSAQRERMFRSRELAEARLLAEIPDVPARVRAWSRGAHTLNRSQSLFTESGWRAAAGSLLAAVRYDPLGVLDRIAALAPGRLRRLLDSSLPRGFPGTGRPFLDWRPDEPHSGPLRPIVLRRLAQLAALDESRGAYVQTGANHERAACDDISGS